MLRYGLLALLAAAGAAVLILVQHERSKPSQTTTSSPPAATEPLTGACRGTVSIGLLAPTTGPSASIGLDQLHWAQFYVADWNRSHTPRLRIVAADTQGDPSTASTAAGKLAADGGIFGVIGPSGSGEVPAVASTLRAAGLAFVSPSATGNALPGGANRGYFFRVVPSEHAQPASAVDYIASRLVDKKGSVLVLDDQDPRTVGPAGAVAAGLRARGVSVARVSVAQGTTDFSSLAARIGRRTKVVYVPFTSPTEVEAFAKALRAAHKSAVAFATDAAYAPGIFDVDGSYLTFFAPEVSSVPVDRALVATFHKRFPGPTTAYGTPAYVAAQVWAAALHQACVDGQLTRASARALLPTASLSTSLLGGPVAFTPQGELAGGVFHVLRVERGRFVTVQ